MRPLLPSSNATSDPVAPPPMTKMSKRSILTSLARRGTRRRSGVDRAAATRSSTRTHSSAVCATDERARSQDHGGSRVVDVEASVGDAGEADVREHRAAFGGDRPAGRARDGLSGAASAASVHASISNLDVDLGCSRGCPSAAVEGCQHLRRSRLARDDPPVDVDLAAVGDDVRRASALDQRGVHGGTSDSGCSRSGSTSASRRRNRAIDVMALTPRSGVSRGHRLPFAVAMIHAPPRSARPTRRSLGSPTMQASWRGARRRAGPWCLQAHELLVGRQVERRACPPRSMPARRIAAAAASAAAIGPFMSAAPRPISRPSSTPCPRRCRQFRGRRRARRRGGRSTRGAAAPGAETRPRSAVAPRAGSSPATRRSPEDVGRDRRRVVLGAAGVLAGRRDQRARERQHLVRVDRRGGRLRDRRHLPWRPMVPVTPCERHCAVRSSRIHRPRPLRGDRAAAVLALFVEEPEASLVFTVRSSWMSRHAGEVSFPAGCRTPASRWQTALREALEELGFDPARRSDGALPPVHTTVSGILVVPFVGMPVSAGVRPSEPRSRGAHVPVAGWPRWSGVEVAPGAGPHLAWLRYEPTATSSGVRPAGCCTRSSGSCGRRRRG